MSSKPLFLGLDLSTQQLKAIIIAEDGSIVHESAVGFDRDLPQYNTTKGAIVGADPREVTSPVAMWLDAFDLLFERLKDSDVDLSQIVAISGAGQQHGSVYWSDKAESLLASLNSEKTLASQLSPEAFSLPNAPIWQDSSTTTECKELEDAVGGAQALANLTGSRAYERFTGSQILKVYKNRPEVYKATSRISLVSSFMPSLFLGTIAPIEISDASGMNLTHIFKHEWLFQLLEICGGPELREKLGPEPVPGGTILGQVSNYWVQRWGLSPSCSVAPFTGDNPASMVSLSTPGDAILSLGTSTTFLLAIPPSSSLPARFTTSHLLSHPTTLSAQIAMLCYKNGALARELVRDRYAEKDWSKFNQLIENTSPGNGGYLGFYFPLPEIIPPNVEGEFFFKNGKPVPSESVPENIHPRAILESQFLSIKSRIAAILPEGSAQLHRIVLTGGSSQNPIICQFSADLFGLPAYVAETKEAAGRGGALLALYAWWKQKREGEGTFEEMKATIVDDFKLVAEPNMEVFKVYEGLLATYQSCENQIIDICKSS